MLTYYFIIKALLKGQYNALIKIVSNLARKQIEKALNKNTFNICELLSV
jgi:hypothetical protein